MPDPPRRMFIAWARVGRRTIELASEVGARLVLIKDRPPYLKAWLMTPNVLYKEKPLTVIAQLPQGPLLARLSGLKGKLSFNLVADVHSGFLVYTSIKTGLDPSRIITVYDPFPRLPPSLKKPRLELETGEYLVFPSSWHPDEPLEYIVREFLSSKAASRYKLVLTGRPHLRGSLRKLISKADGKVILTGYLPWEEYYWLLSNAKAVIAATTKEYTMLSAAWEAAAVRKPLILGRTETLKSIIGDYAVYFEVDVRGSLSSILNNIDSISLDVDGFSKHLESLSRASIRGLIERLKELEAR